MGVICAYKIFTLGVIVLDAEKKCDPYIFFLSDPYTNERTRNVEIHENQVFQLLHETRKTFQVQSIELMYFSFNNTYDI